MQIETERKVRMEINIEKLKQTVIQRNTTLEALAYELGINRSTLYRKLKRGPSAITLKDADTISKSLGLSQLEADSIFGGSYVPYM